MATNAIFRNFTASEPFRNKYMRSRGIFEIKDANLHHGDVRPFACPELLCENVGKYRSLFPLEECPCLGYESPIKPVQGFCRNQFFYLKNGYLMQATRESLCAKIDDCRAGVPFGPQPSASPSCSGCDGTAVSYVITYVTNHGGIEVEGPPSPASSPVAGSGNVPGVGVSWGNAPQGYCIAKTRLYRTESDSLLHGKISDPGSEYVLVAEFSGGGARSFVDNVSSSATGHPLMTYAPMAFPAPGDLISLARTEDCLLVVQRNRVFISLQGKPQFSWDGVVEIEDDIQHMVAIGDNVYIFTNKRPTHIYFVYGNDGELKINRHTIERNLPLTSISSVSVGVDKVFFATTYALYSWKMNRQREGTFTDELTPLLSPEQWKNIDPYSVVGTAYEFGYIFSSDRMDYSLMLQFAGDGVDTVQQTTLMPITYIKNPTAFTIDNDGIITYCEDENIYTWDWRRDVCSEFEVYDHVRPTVCEQCECCPWSVKFYYDNNGKNHFSHMKVEWDERSAPNLWISFHIHEFGREVERTDKMEIISSRAFGIPFRNISYQSCYAHITGCGIMHEVKLGTSAQEVIYDQAGNVAAEGEE